jgi:hypothetical protein
MSEKQVKHERQEERQTADIPIATLTFSLMRNGNVSVSGPIANPVAVFDMVGKGCISLAMYYQNAQQQQGPQILKADPMTLQALNHAAKKAGVIQ